MVKGCSTRLWKYSSTDKENQHIFKSEKNFKNSFSGCSPIKSNRHRMLSLTLEERDPLQTFHRRKKHRDKSWICRRSNGRKEARTVESMTMVKTVPDERWEPWSLHTDCSRPHSEKLLSSELSFIARTAFVLNQKDRRPVGQSPWEARCELQMFSSNGVTRST